MRILQNVLLVVGVASLGTVVGFLGIAFLISLIQAPGGEPWTRGFGQYIGGLIFAPLGTLASLIGSIGWLRFRPDHRTWSPGIWTGVVLGLVAGWAAVNYWDQHGGLDHWIWTTLFVSATSTIGGMIGRATLPIPSPTKKAMKPKVR